MNDLKELQEEIRWLKDEPSAATNIDDDLENIKDDISEIKSDQRRLFDAYSTIAVHINQHTEALKKLLLVEVLTPKPPPSDMLGEFSAKAPTNKPKERSGKPKPRKTKLSVVPKDGNDGAAR